MAAESKAVEVVQMQDGTQMTFTGKRKLIKTSAITEEGVHIYLNFRNGVILTLRLRDDMIFKYAAHGGEQKMGDEISGLDDIDDCVLASRKLIERLDNGEWNTRREGGSALAGTSVLMRALIIYTGKTPEEIKTFLDSKSQAEKVALRNNPKIRPIVDEIEAEKAAKNNKVDTEALLGELS